MKNTKFIAFLAITFLISGTFAFSNFDKVLISENSTKEELILETPFDKMMAVLMHKRCVNCHPSSDMPRQGEDSHLHNFGVVRGEDGHGLAGYTCNTCHTDQNNDYSGVPGAPDWALAPAMMAWEGKTRVEIATQMMDPARNGGRNPKEIEEHLTAHELVLWAWEPGVNAEGIPREKPPVPKEEYITAVKEWIENGAIIPEK